jgi:uncharacterized protein with beta-barrel porin domain
MNHVYRLVWSHTHKALIAVSETSRSRSKTGGRAKTVASAVASALLTISGTSATLASLPAFAEDAVVNSETYTNSGLSYGTLDSFTNSSLIMSPENAVNIIGNVTSGIANSGVINSSKDGVVVNGNLSGGFTNSSTGLVLSKNIAINLRGDFAGGFTNEGRIFAHDSHGLYVNGLMTGHFTNTSSGQIRANDIAAQLTGGLVGNFTNHGEISSGSSVGIAIQGPGITGDLLNSATGHIYTKDHAIQVSGLLDGNFTNSGKIVAGEYGLFVDGNMEGNFSNTSTGQIFTRNSAVIVRQNLTGHLENEGHIVSGGSYGVFVNGSFEGSFTNAASASILAREAALFSPSVNNYNNDSNNTFNGNISNAGLMSGASGGIVIGGTITGNFTNALTGIIQGGTRDAVALGGGVIGNINNAGSIIGNRDFGTDIYGSTLPVIEFSNRDPWNNNYQYYYDNNLGLTYVPNHIGINPRTGIYVHGDVDGNFVNSGTIRAAQAVFIDGNLNGDYDNTGIIEGGFSGYTTTGEQTDPTKGITGNRSFSGNSAIITGNFNGNFRTTVGQGILVGDYLHSWKPGDGAEVTEENTTVSLQDGTGTADLRGKTVAVYVNQAIAAGYEWTAIDAGNTKLLLDGGMAITDNLNLFDFTYDASQIANGDLVIKADFAWSPETPVTSFSDYNGVTYTGPQGFTIDSGTTILNGATAVYVSGDVTGNVTNSGEIINTGIKNDDLNGDYSSDIYGIYFSGNLNANFDNTATGKIYSADNFAMYVEGNVSGSIANDGEITSGDCYGVYVVGSMDGDLTNSQTGRMHANNNVFTVMGGHTGNITNQGLIISADANAVLITQTMTGDFLNSSTAGIFSRSTAFEVYQSSLVGNITNHGEIMSSNASGIIVGDVMTGNFLNSASGRIWTKSTSVSMSDGLIGNFTNQGDIVSGDSHGVYIYGSLNGNFTNSAGASIWANDIGVLLSASVTGSFTNDGEIYANNSHGVFFNSLNDDVNLMGNFVNGATGEIRARENAVQINKTLNGDFTNHGLIASSGYVYEYDPSYCEYDIDWNCTFVPLPIIRTNLGSGVIVGGFAQGYADQIGFFDDLTQPYFMTGTFTNSATGSIIGFGSGVHIRAGLDGDLNNLGLIKANAGDAIKLGGVLTGTINNSGTLEATDGAGIHVTSSVSGGQISNFGSINATDNASGKPGAGSGIYVADSGALTSITNTSTGTIKGSFKSINLANATNPTTVNNSGVLDGDVYLGTAGNVLNINGDVARIIGNVANNGASSTVNINGTFDSEGTFNVGLFNVNDGGVFNMNHSITATTTTVNNGGTLNVGTGDRNIVGDYFQYGGGTLRFSLTDPTTYGSLNVSGNATVSDGAKIDVVLNGTPASRIDGVLVAGGTLTTNPANIIVTDNSAFYNFTASTARDINELDLISAVDQNAFTTEATRPTRGVAGAMQYMLNNGVPGALQPTFNVLDTMNPSQLNNALLEMTPALQGATTQAVVNSLRNVNKVIQSRYESVNGLSSGEASNEQAGWFKTFGNKGEQGNSNTVPGYDSRSYGMVFGMDKLITDQTRAGALFTYVRTDIDSNTGDARVNVDTYKIATYASYSIDPKTDINFQIDYGVHRANSARSIEYMGTRAKADFDGSDWHIAAGIGHTIDLTEKSSVTPSLRLDYTNFRTDSYTEKGADALNNHVESSVYEELLLDMGAKFTHQLNDNGLKFIANGGVAYDFINETAQATSYLIGGGPSFVTKGLDPSPWLYRGGLGLVKAADNGLELSARYDVESRSSDYINQTASVNLRWNF